MPSLASLFRRRIQAPAAPWLSVHAGESALLGALALPGGDTGPRVELMPPAAVPADSAALRAWRQRCGRRVRANVVLRAADYRVLPIEPPPLAPDELREAARWQIADALDFPVEEAAIDLMTVPTHPNSTRKLRFVVAAPSERITSWVGCCKMAALPLAAIDIPEMAMRNLSVLAAGDAPHAFLYVGFRSTRLALIWKRELCSFRQLEIPGRLLAEGGDEERGEVLERLGLEIQRTADSFARQLPGFELETLWLASVVDPAGLADRLALQVPHRVQVFQVAEHVQVVGGAVVDASRGHDHLLAIGGALRQEAS